MSVIIREVLDATPGGCRVRFEHCGRLADAEFAEPPEDARRRVGKPESVELGYIAVLHWSKLATLPPGAAGISAAEPAATRIVGEIWQATDMGDGTLVYVLGVANGPESLSVDSDELGDRNLAVGTPLEVTVEGLCLYPINL